MKDYKTITDDVTGGLVGEWWRLPPYAVRLRSYAPYQGEGLRPVRVRASALVSMGDQTPAEDPTSVEPPIPLRARWYDPVTERMGLLNALLDVAQGRLKPKSFADRFGLLGYNFLVPPEYRCKGGDPLDWFLAQARTVCVLTALAGLVRVARASTAERMELAKFLAREISNGPYALGGRVVTTMLRAKHSNPVSAASGILRWLINENLGDTRRRIQSLGQHFRTIFVFRALVEVVYWQLADQLDKSSIHRCRECGRVFVHPNRRLRFCPPEGKKKISRCKSRWNVRRFRKRIERKGRKKR